MARASDSVNAAKPLDDPDRVPVDVVIDEVIAVLEVLALGDAIGGDEQVDFAVDFGIEQILFLRARRKER